MNDLRRFLSFLCIPLLFLVGMKNVLIAHLGHIGLPSLEAWLKAQVMHVPSSWGHIWWVLILMLPVVLFALWLHQRYSGKTLSLDTQAGNSLVIRQKAIERYIRECLMARPFVKDVRITTKGIRGKLTVKLRVSISADRQIHLLQQQLVEQVVEDAKRGFGITDMPIPDIIVEAVQSPQPETVQAKYPDPEQTALPGVPAETPETEEAVDAPVETTEPTDPTDQQMEATEAEAVDAEEIVEQEETIDDLTEALETAPKPETDDPAEPEDDLAEALVGEEAAKVDETPEEAETEAEEEAVNLTDYTFATLGDKSFNAPAQEEEDKNKGTEEKKDDVKEPEV